MQPLFLPGPNGPLFASLYSASAKPQSRRWVLHVPAFAEEMNKCRALVSSQSRSLAANGSNVLVPDFYGTGDSAGEFGQASWEAWLEELKWIVDWIDQQGCDQLCLWGVRLGALMALEFERCSAREISQYLLWQPVNSGKQSIVQFLRLRLAASMMGGGGESMSDLDAILEGGSNLEVAGYSIAPAMVNQIRALKMPSAGPQGAGRINWFEIASSAEKPLSPAIIKLQNSWREADVDLHVDTVPGDPFWMTQELGSAPALIKASSEAVTASWQAPNRYLAQCKAMPPELISPVASSGEEAITMVCAGEELAGILHRGKEGARRAVLVVVGGPQYRVGSHRQFLQLARSLAQAGIPVLRMDYRGMGDSSGVLLGFESIDDDIRCGVDALIEQIPSVREVVIWGLCDAATAGAFYAPNDDRVKGLVLLNPWVRSEEGAAKAYIKHYYLQRLVNPEFWRKVRRGEFEIAASLTSLRQTIATAFRRGHTENTPATDASEKGATGALVERMQVSLAAFGGKVLMIFSGNDLTAAEFLDAVESNAKFGEIISGPDYTQCKLAAADHTFSRQDWKDQVAVFTANWVQDTPF